MSAGITGTIYASISLDGVVSSATLNTAGSVAPKAQAILTAGQPGLMAYTSTTAGTLTMTNADHGIVTGNIIGIFWSGGRAYTVTAGTVSGVTIPFTNASGTEIPNNGATAVVVSVRTAIPAFGIESTNMKQLLVTSTGVGVCILFSSTSTFELAADVAAANGCYNWPNYSGQSAPFSADITSCAMYNGSTSEATMTTVALVT